MITLKISTQSPYRLDPNHPDHRRSNSYIGVVDEAAFVPVLGSSFGCHLGDRSLIKNAHAQVVLAEHCFHADQFTQITHLGGWVKGIKLAHQAWVVDIEVVPA